MTVDAKRIDALQEEGRTFPPPPDFAAQANAQPGIYDRSLEDFWTEEGTLKGGQEGSVELLAELRNHVGKKIGKIAAPANILFTPELPMTRSGKIMRRLLRDVAENRPLGDTTTLADPAVVEELRSRAVTEEGKEN
jgi:acetyl-CoA synthetase